jgi:hypothetical protein
VSRNTAEQRQNKDLQGSRQEHRCCGCNVIPVLENISIPPPGNLLHGPRKHRFHLIFRAPGFYVVSRAVVVVVSFGTCRAVRLLGPPSAKLGYRAGGPRVFSISYMGLMRVCPLPGRLRLLAWGDQSPANENGKGVEAREFTVIYGVRRRIQEWTAESRGRLGHPTSERTTGADTPY